MTFSVAFLFPGKSFNLLYNLTCLINKICFPVGILYLSHSIAEIFCTFPLAGDDQLSSFVDKATLPVVIQDSSQILAGLTSHFPLRTGIRCRHERQHKGD